MMDGLLGKGGEVIFNYGVLGVAFLLTVFVAWQLWRALQDSQQKRLEDSIKLHTALESNTNALENLTKVIELNLSRRRAR